MTNRLQSKVAVITGAGSGIGAATAHAMAREGASVIVAGRNADSEEAVAEEAALIVTAAKHFGRPDILHNNAGAVQLAVDSDLVSTPESAWRRPYDTSA